MQAVSPLPVPRVVFALRRAMPFGMNSRLVPLAFAWAGVKQRGGKVARAHVSFTTLAAHTPSNACGGHARCAAMSPGGVAVTGRCFHARLRPWPDPDRDRDRDRLAVTRRLAWHACRSPG